MQIKKFAQSDRYGNSLSIEFEVPPIQNEIPKFEDYFNHPGKPKGTDTVPAWLTPGERVMNAEAERMYGPQLEAMNEQGRAIQRAQGGTIPEYAAGGCKVKYAAKGSKVSCDCPECSRTVYAAEGELIPYPEVPMQPGTLSTEIPTPYDPYTINARRLLVEHEGYKTKPYQDHLGNWTVGAGHKIVDKDTLAKLNKGESVEYQPEQLMGFFEKDYNTAYTGAKQNFKDFNSYPDELQHALLSMNYQLGTEGTSKFEKMRKALDEKDWDKAAYEAGNSKWAKQTPVRAAYLQSKLRQMKDAPLVTEMDIPMSDSDAPIIGANGEQYNIDTLTASTTPPVPQSEPVVPKPKEEYTLDVGFETYAEDPERKNYEGRDLIFNHSGEIVGNESFDVAGSQGLEQPSDVPQIERDLIEFRKNNPYSRKSDDDILNDLKKEKEKVDKVKPLSVKETTEMLKQKDKAGTISTEEKSGLDYLSSFGDKAGEVLSDLFGWLKDRAVDTGLLDQRALTRAAILYAGGLGLGYNRETAGQFALKNYFSDLSSKEKNISKLVSEGKYDPKSIQAYKLSGDINDLKLKSTFKFENEKMFNIGGKPVRAYLDKTTGQYAIPDPNKPGGIIGYVPSRANEWTAKPEDYENWVQKNEDDADKIITKAFQGEDVPENFTLTGYSAINDVAAYALDKGVPLDSVKARINLNKVTENALRAAAKYQKENPDETINSILPFLSQEFSSTVYGLDSDLFLTEEGEMITPTMLQPYLEQVSEIAIRSEDKNITPQLLFTRIQNTWNSLSDKSKASYGSPGDKENQFYLFLRDVLGDRKITDEELDAKTINESNR